MGRITSDVGLITGLPITATVDQLIALQARPRDLLVARTKKLQEEQVAVKDLAARLLSMKFSLARLNNVKLFQQKVATSSNPDVLTPFVSGDPAAGSHTFTVLQVAQAQQYLSDGIASTTSPLGEGTVSFRFGRSLEGNVDLELLNAGKGFDAGKILITDRSGDSAEIDLKLAKTIEDVLEAINSNSTINVTALTDGDSILLVDNTGQTTSNLKVQEVGTGKTAASLGLNGINAAANSATGEDVLKLFGQLNLGLLNDGQGLRLASAGADLSITLRDNGSAVSIDLDSGGKPTTLQEVLDKINAAAPARLKAEIAAGGDHLVLTDLSTDNGGTFSITQQNGSHAAQDLGIAVAASGGTITGKRALGGLQSSLLKSLNGGQGLGTLGLLHLQDRSGASADVNLAGKETIDQVLKAINASGLALEARLNTAKNGIEIVDTSGSVTSHLVVSNGDANNSADKLHLAVDAEVNSKNSGDLHLRIIGENSRLESLNGGSGVAEGTLRIVDTLGVSRTITVNKDTKTIGDVIKVINDLDFAVEARVNDHGDGILLVDTAHGSQTLQVVAGSSTTARDLHLLVTAKKVDVGGTLTDTIDGSHTALIALDADDDLDDLISRVNNLSFGISAGKFNDGSASNPNHFTLRSDRTGAAGRIVVDTSAIDLSLNESVRGVDSRLLLGTLGSVGTPPIATSSTDVFKDVIAGVTLQAQSASSFPVTIAINKANTNLSNTLQAVVDTYNNFRDKVKEYTKFDERTQVGAVLLGDANTIRAESSLANLLSSRFFGAGSITALESIGISIKDDGKLEFNPTELNAKIASDPDAVQKFFLQARTGFVAKLDSLLEQVAGDENAQLITRDAALARRIATNSERIDQYTARLGRSRERLLKQFRATELAIGKIRSNLDAINSLAALAVTPK